MKFDEIPENKVFRTLTQRVTKKEIYSFASQYDPQYMHVDEEKAKNSMFGGMIASGLHTLSLTWKLWVEMALLGDDVIGGVGMDNVKFLRPVYPGDELYVEAEVIDKKEHPKKSDRGYFILLLKTFNQNEQQVLRVELTGLVKR